jgi:HK97 family phage portal protein
LADNRSGPGAIVGAVRILGREIRWSEPPPETRALEQADIGVAFAEAIAEAEGYADTLPAVYRAAQITTDLPASLPLEAIGRTGIADPLTPELLTQPNPLETYTTTIRKLVGSMVWRGTGYMRAITRTTSGLITTAEVLNPDEVTVTWDRARINKLYKWRDRPMELWREIFPVSINEPPGALTGRGPIEAARLLIEGAKAEARMARTIFEADVVPPGVLKVPRPLTQPEAEAVQDSWSSAHGGGRKRPAVLSGGVEFEALTINPVDAQFLESRNFSIQEIARLFGLPGYFLLVASGESMTYSTTEGLMRLYLTLTLSPTYLEPIEKMFSMMLPVDQTARFRRSELLAADLTNRFEAYRVGLEAGFLTVDEVRTAEHLPPIETPAPRPRETAEL